MSVKEWKNYPATYFLLGLTTLVFVLQYIMSPFSATQAQSLFNMGAMYGLVVQYDPMQLWRLVTPIFVHIGFQHFLFNMLTLYFLGRIAERIFGTLRFFSLYLLAGLMGNAFTLLFTPEVVAAGASTSIFGLFAAVVILGYYSRSPYLNQLGRSYMALIAFNLLFNLFTPNVGIAGHIGGLVGGALAAIFLANRVERGLFTKTWRGLALVTYVILMVLVLAYTYFL